MPYCLNPACHQPYNHQDAKFCTSCGANLLLKQHYLAIGQIGQGGFGRTFVARDITLPSQPHCVIKQLYVQDGTIAVQKKALKLFKQEATRLDQLGKHPQIPKLLAYFEQDNHFYLVQELVEGKTLGEESWQDNGNREDKAWQLLQDILPVLQYIHEREVVHRDIKPENIMRRREDGKLILIDFGVARLITQTALLGQATIIGTLEYMAPEQARGKVLPASDLYSLGVTCIHMLTGLPTPEMFDTFRDQWLWRDYLPREAPVSTKLGKIIDKLVQSSLQKRYRSAAEALKEVNSAVYLRTMIHVTTEAKSDQLPRKRKQSISQNLVPTEVFVVDTPPPIDAYQSPTQLIQPGLFEEPIEFIAIDYSNLKTLLMRHKWQQADEETWAILSQLARKRVGSYLFGEDLEKIPCNDLAMLDVLWVKHSQQQFGFSVQQRIYDEVSGEYNQFCDRVGWPTYQSRPSSSNFLFSLKAPLGHLPSRRWVGGYTWWQHAKVLATRIKECDINY